MSSSSNSLLSAACLFASLLSSGCGSEQKKPTTPALGPTTPVSEPGPAREAAVVEPELEPESEEATTPAPAATTPAPATSPALGRPVSASSPLNAPPPPPPPVAGRRPAPPEPKGPPPDDLVRSATLAVRGGQYEVAIRTAKQALKRDEKFVPAMVILARAYYHLHKYELATSILDIAKGIDAKNAQIPHLLGFIELEQGNKPAALVLFRKATEIQPDLAGAWNNLGAQYLAGKNYKEAAPALETAAGLSPNSARVQLNLGSAFRGMGEVQKAESAYRSALRIRADYPEAYYNLGILYLDAASFPGMDTLARLGSAIQHLTRYKEMKGARLAKDDPVDSYMDEARKAIEKEQKRLERERRRQAPKPAPAVSPTPSSGPGAAGKPEPPPAASPTPPSK